MSAHTPGPWHVGDITFAEVPTHDGSRKGRLAASIHHSESRFTMIRVGARSDDQGEVSANAHLVAAAPDLLASLKSLLAFVRDHTENGEVIPPYTIEHERAVAAIARAEGRHP